jgi:2-keto-3-deoxy-6-phosphogluconate aldolase
LVVVALVLFAACDPAAVADKAVQRTAESVVTPVANADMPAEVAEAASRCIVGAATPDEARLLARDVGVEAGTSTKATIRAIALRPAAQECFAARGVPPIR